MKVLIAGGSGFIGSALAKSLQWDGHAVWILTRRRAIHPNEIQWDGRSVGGWSARLGEVDALVNATGYGLEHWPWTASRKRRFLDSRVLPGKALVSAIKNSSRRPRVFLQISGINYYGLRGDMVADETAQPADDYLARLTVQWEAAAQPLEALGVRHITARSAVVLDARKGLFPLMALPVRLFIGGPLGTGKQAVPWIHVADQVGALRFLLEHEDARGAFNLVAPERTSNMEFTRAIAKALQRPYWLRLPAFLLRLSLGEMSALVIEGRYSQPRRLLEFGYKFRFPTIESALDDLFG